MNTPAKKKRKGVRYIVVQILFAVIVVIALVCYFSTETKVAVENRNIQIAGIYGQTIPFDSIDQVSLLDTMPEIVRRTNGYSFLSVKKGYFKTEDGRTVKLFLHSSEAPYLKISDKSGTSVFINYKDSGLTERVYGEIFKQIN